MEIRWSLLIKRLFTRNQVDFSFAIETRNDTLSRPALQSVTFIDLSMSKYVIEQAFIVRTIL